MQEKVRNRSDDEIFDRFMASFKKSVDNPEIKEAMLSTMEFALYVEKHPEFQKILLEGAEKAQKEEKSVVSAKVVPAKGELSDKMFCKDCCAKIDRDSNFCRECGLKQV